MSKYTVPYQFVAGTKASAEEVNENFTYLQDILSNIGIAKYPFCVNYGNRDSSGKEDLFDFTDSEVMSKIGNAYDEFAYTLGNGVPSSITEASLATVTPTKYASVVPIFSSSVIEDASCTATSEEPGHEAYCAFDKNIDSYWGSFVGVTTASLAISLNARYVIDYYYLKILAPANWILEGSNDSNVWTVLDEYSAAEATTITRPINHKGNFQSYRLRVTSPDDSYQIMVAELDLYQKSSVGTLGLPETQIIYIGENGLAVSNNKYFRQDIEPVGITKYSPAIPEMISNLVPDGYHISASSYSAMNAPYLATDRKEDTYWEATEDLNNVWFQVQLPNSINVKACKITLRPDEKAVDQALINGELAGSNNGITWTTLYTFKELEWSYSAESKYFYFTKNETKFSYYRLTGEVPFAALGEFQLYYEDIDGEYLLGEADIGDIWFKSSEPYNSYEYLGSNIWQEYSYVPAGEATLDESGIIKSVETYPYNQNGYNINAMTTRENSGNIVTYDSYTSHFRPSGYAVLPSGLIIQWGESAGQEQILFPATFPNSVFSIIANPATSDSTAQSTIASLSRSGFRINNSDSTSESADVQNYWIAIGW